MVALLNVEDEIFSSIKIEFVNPDNSKEIIDLKNANILKEIIMQDVEATGYEFIINEIEISYHLNNNPGEMAFQRFNNLIMNINLPNITPHHNNMALVAPDEGA